MEDKYVCESVRLCRFLYSLGFDKESRTDENGREYWVFEKDENLQRALSFYFNFRKRMHTEMEKKNKKQ